MSPGDAGRPGSVVAGGFGGLNIPIALSNRAPHLGYPAAYTSELLAGLSPPFTAVGLVRAAAPFAPAIEIPMPPR